MLALALARASTRRAPQLLLRWAPPAPSSASAALRRLSSAPSDDSAVTDLTDPALGLSPDALAYYEAARAFAAKEMAPHAARWDEKHEFPLPTLRAAAALGFGAMFVDPARGGSGLSRAEAVPVIEALAAACPSTAAFLTIHNMVLGMLDKHASDALRARLMPRLTTMELVASYCLTEPNSGSDAASLQTRAVRDGDDFVLTGSKAFISGGGASDVYLVMARTGPAGSTGAAGISAILVEKGTPGLSFGKLERKMGWNSQPTRAVFFEGARVPAGNLVGELGQGFKYAMQGLDGGRLSIAACSVGAAHTAFNLARDHVKVRKQFGKPLAAFQNTQFEIADMASDLYGARSVVRAAATLLDVGSPVARSACANAKRVATDLGFSVCDRALQLHGGYGYLQDYPLEKLVRDTRVHRILEGTNQVMRIILSRALLE